MCFFMKYIFWKEQSQIKIAYLMSVNIKWNNSSKRIHRMYQNLSGRKFNDRRVMEICSFQFLAT
jgi:hypothetical protein